MTFTGKVAHRPRTYAEVVRNGPARLPTVPQAIHKTVVINSEAPTGKKPQIAVAPRPLESTHVGTVASSQKASAAELHVFRTYELIEAILLALPPSDIVLAAKTNTIWRDIVERSPALRDRVFQARYDGVSAEDTAAGSLFLYIDGRQGTLIIRRLENVEVIAFIKNENHKMQIVDGERMVVDFVFVEDYVWGYRCHDIVRDEPYSGLLYTANRELKDYLTSFHTPMKRMSFHGFQFR
jgi:hypothetical protein